MFVKALRLLRKRGMSNCQGARRSFITQTVGPNMIVTRYSVPLRQCRIKTNKVINGAIHEIDSYQNRTEHIFIDIKLRPLTGSVRAISQSLNGPNMRFWNFRKCPKSLRYPFKRQSRLQQTTNFAAFLLIFERNKE